MVTVGGNFQSRHIGPNDKQSKEMLALLKVSSLDELCQETIPSSILEEKNLTKLKPALAEHEALAELRSIANQNKITKNESKTHRRY